MPDPAHSERYDQALVWAAQLHRGQRRKGKPVPTISHLISVSALVWEDGGGEDQAIAAALLHDAIEDAKQDHGSIAERFGAAVADIVVACTDTGGPIATGAKKPSWLERKRHTIESLPNKRQAALLVIAADKAHNARDLMIDSSRDPESWMRFRQGVRGACWYLSSLHSQLQERLPHSRSVRQLGESVEAILASEAVQTSLEPGRSAQEWVAEYLEWAQIQSR